MNGTFLTRGKLGELGGLMPRHTYSRNADDRESEVT